MSEKNINTRVINKHDIEANWKKATTFIPKQGELIVYDIDNTYSYERFKIGDGKTLVNNLTFASMPPDWNQTDETKNDYIKNKPELVELAHDLSTPGKAADAKLTGDTIAELRESTETKTDAMAKLSESKSYTDAKIGELSEVFSSVAYQMIKKTEIDSLELITVNDIDAICGTIIQDTTTSEVKF